jgi:hypothetical protein
MISINIPVFILSLLFGLLYVYISDPKSKEITVYTTQDNENLFQFRDKINNCFHLHRNTVQCSNDAEVIPIQI